MATNHEVGSSILSGRTILLILPVSSRIPFESLEDQLPKGRRRDANSRANSLYPTPELNLWKIQDVCGPHQSIPL
jgi:hypothetical protein